MCQFCEKYGNGAKWYLNPENYARRLYKVRTPEKEQKGREADPQSAGMGGGAINEIIKMRIKGEKDKEEKFTCVGIGPGMYKWERWPETYRGGVEFLSPDEAKEWTLMMDKQGFVHT